MGWYSRADAAEAVECVRFGSPEHVDCHTPGCSHVHAFPAYYEVRFAEHFKQLIESVLHNISGV